MSRIHWRDALLAILIALATGLAAASPALGLLHGVSIDVLTALRWRVFARSHDPAASPAVVVAIDEETYRTPPFAGTPTLTWTREIGRVLTAVADGGAKVVGFDMIFPSSIEQSEIPLGDETLGERLRGFDRDFLRALAVAARANKIVLGQIQHQDHPIAPSPGQRIAVGQIQNIRSLNVHADLDNVCGGCRSCSRLPESTRPRCHSNWRRVPSIPRRSGQATRSCLRVTAFQRRCQTR